MTIMTKEPFQPFTDDLDNQLERIAHAKGVPALTNEPSAPRQDPPLQSLQEQGAYQDHSLTPQAPLPPQPANALLPAEPAPTPPPEPEKMHARLKIPEYLMIELKIQSVRRRVSLNHLFLAGLKATGFTVRDEDLVEDGRRLRGKAAPQNPDATQ